MAQPPAYARAFSFTNWTANHPTTPQPGVSLDNEFGAVATSIAGIRTNLALIQRDDGQLANGVVGPDQLSAALTMGLRSVSDWATATAYVVNDAVWTNSKLYRAETAHTSALLFATDLAASKWTEIMDLVPYAETALLGVVVGGITVDENAIADLLATKAELAGANIFSARQRITAGGATEPLDYLSLRPSDYAAGKPEFVIRKLAGATAWEIAVTDGAPEVDGTMNFVFTALTLNGVALLTAADITSLQADIAHAKRMAFVF